MTALNEPAQETNIMKINNQDLPTFDLVVTRHAPLVEWLRRDGHISADTPVVEHAHSDVHPARVVQVGSGYEVHAGHRLLGHEVPLEANAKAFADRHNSRNVRGKHVIGVLPHHLSAKAASVTEVQLDWSIADREAMQRGDLDVDAVHRAARGLHTYRVRNAVARSWAVFEDAEHFSDACLGGCYFSGIGDWRGLATIEFSDVGQSVWGDVLPSRGLWRKHLGAWTDAFGREVADDDITPGPAWGVRIRAASSTTGQPPNVEVTPMHWPSLRRWETAELALSELPSLGISVDVEIIAGREHGSESIVLARWSPTAA